MRLLASWIINALVLLALPYLLSSIQVRDFWTALWFALALGLLNTFLRPILLLLTLPINILTLGLFTFVINALTFWAASMLVDGIRLAGFWPAFWGALAFSVLSTIASYVLLPDKH